MQPATQSKKNAGKTLFQLAKKGEVSQQAEKKCLEDFPVIKPGVGEKILCVQRKHKIALIGSFVPPVLFIIFFLFLLIFVSGLLPQIILTIIHSWVFITYVILTVISWFLITMIFIYMTWYYEFYIITNRSILHRYCFRISGPYSDIVYGERMHVREITRVPPNLLCDFLKIEDVYIYFQKIEQEEPFIFNIPSDAQQIEDLLHDLAILRNKHQKYD